MFIITNKFSIFIIYCLNCSFLFTVKHRNLWIICVKGQPSPWKYQLGQTVAAIVGGNVLRSARRLKTSLLIKFARQLSPWFRMLFFDQNVESRSRWSTSTKWCSEKRCLGRLLSFKSRMCHRQWRIVGLFQFVTSSRYCRISYREGLVTCSLVLVITKYDYYKKKDHTINSKIPKFGVKQMNS